MCSLFRRFEQEFAADGTHSRIGEAGSQFGYRVGFDRLPRIQKDEYFASSTLYRLIQGMSLSLGVVENHWTNIGDVLAKNRRCSIDGSVGSYHNLKSVLR